MSTDSGELGLRVLAIAIYKILVTFEPHHKILLRNSFILSHVLNNQDYRVASEGTWIRLQYDKIKPWVARVVQG